MKSCFKKTLCVLLCCLFALSALSTAAFAADAYEPVADGDFLHTEGDKILNADGEEVVLRGTNFGGWGIMEDWFCPFEDPAGEENAYDAIVERFGADAARELFKTYRANWITEIDFKNVADAGMNVIRLPIWYRNFQSDDKGTWYRDAAGNIDFSELDEMVRLCNKYGLYIIIDLHGLAGYQNDYDHCGRSKSMSLFDDTDAGRAYRALAIDFWTELAKHYAGEPTVAMYDLMNEPCGTNITRDGSIKETFWELSNDIYNAVRAVDPDHIISMEAIWDPSAIASPDVYGWENIVYQEHLYDVTNPAVLRKVNEIRDCGYNAPFYIGEFYPRGISGFNYIFSLYTDRALSWTTWTYKGAGPAADNSPWFLYGSSKIEKIDYRNDSYETMMEKWGEVLRTDGGKFSRTDFADYVAGFTDGQVDEASLKTFGAIDTSGTLEQRWSLFVAKLQAILTTIKDWLRKLSTGDLL